MIFGNNDQKQNNDKLREWKDKIDQHKPGLLKKGPRKYDTQEIDPEEIKAKRAAGGEAENSSVDFGVEDDVPDPRMSGNATDHSDEVFESVGAVGAEAGTDVGIDEGDAFFVDPEEETAGSIRPRRSSRQHRQESPRTQRQGLTRKHWQRLAIAAAALLIAVGGIFYYITFTVSATVTTEGEAPIVFYVNHRDQVLRAEALNKEGEDVLKKVGDISRRPDLKDVLARTEAVMKKMGLLGEDEHLTYVRDKGRDGRKDTDPDDVNNGQGEDVTQAPATEDQTRETRARKSDDTEKDRDSQDGDTDAQTEPSKEPPDDPGTEPETPADDSGGEDDGGQTSPPDDSGGGSDDGGGGQAPPSNDSGGSSGGDSGDDGGAGSGGES